MSEQIGKLVTCTRCKNTVFLKYLKSVGGSNYTDPGYSRAVYEDLPGDWMHATGMGDLCPKCAREFIKYLKEFFGEENYEGFASCWKIKEKENEQQ